MIKRIIDLLFSFIGAFILVPFFIIISIVIIIADGFPVFYFQKRVGKGGKDFFLLKLRTMKKNSDKKGLITIGGRDPRITRTGFFLRRSKIDELPQLLNVLYGDMSLVGPRPEVRKYVELYSREQKRVLDVRPGITDPASLAYANENELLAGSKDPEKTYTSEIMPAKLKLSLDYIARRSNLNDMKIIFRTIFRTN